jgi:hypothetical protein
MEERMRTLGIAGSTGLLLAFMAANAGLPIAAIRSIVTLDHKPILP